ncbi:HEAT repeat domain-containing protein [Prosthecobacter fluviatilis]|uniref:HEAT repeat domain-containing protein n=1 Tax=Prosthecobacter fluviatilis TaxID=445931 RepID=A0ABW0KVW2_9BACT
MSFLFRGRAGRVCWVVCAMLALQCIAAAQEYFPTPEEKQSARPQPWQAAGLRAALADASPLLRSLAVQHITWKHWGDGLLTAKDLEPLLQSPDEEIKKRAAKALEQLSPTPTPGGAGAAEKERDPAPPEGAEAGKKAPEKIAPERVKELLTQLHDPHFYERESAVKALGQAGPLATEEMVSALVPLLQDDDFGVVLSTVQALRNMDREEGACRKALLSLLKAKDSGPQDVFPAKTPAWSARHDAMYLLIYGGPGEGLYSEGIPFILPLLTDPERYVREAVVVCLQKVGPRLVPYLKDLLPLLKDESKPMVQALAARALTAVGDEAAPTVARALLPLLQSKEPYLPCTVIDSLGCMGPSAAPVALPALLPFLKKKNEECRLCAVVALGQLGPAAAPAARDLLAVLDDPDTQGLGHLGNFSQHIAAEALGQLGPSVVPLVVPALVQHFKDGDNTLNRHILRALERMGPAAAAPAISSSLPLLQSTDLLTRYWAIEPLELWGNLQRDPAWQCAALAGAAAAVDDKDLQSLRFSLYLWSGHDPELLLSVRWLGRPADPLPAKGTALSAQEQQAVLRTLLKLWPHSAAYPAVRREMAQRAADVAQSIGATPDEEVVALFTRLEASLKADDVKETQPASATARSAVERVLARSAGKK